MAEANGGRLPPVAKTWIGLYCFAAFWLLLVASLDASHFGPGFFPFLISLGLVPLLTLVFVIDLINRVFDAFHGKGASLSRRLWPLLVAATGVVVYGGVCVLFIVER